MILKKKGRAKKKWCIIFGAKIHLMRCRNGFDAYILLCKMYAQKTKQLPCSAKMLCFVFFTKSKTKQSKKQRCRNRVLCFKAIACAKMHFCIRLFWQRKASHFAKQNVMQEVKNNYFIKNKEHFAYTLFILFLQFKIKMCYFCTFCKTKCHFC